MIPQERQISIELQPVPKLSSIAAMKVASFFLHQKIVAEYPCNRKSFENKFCTSLRLRHDHGIIPLAIHNWNNIGELMLLPLWKEVPQIFLIASEIQIMTDISPLTKDEVPIEVNAIINRAGFRMAYELWSWIYRHCNVFNDRITLEIIIVHLFDEFVWYPDGTLNYEQTVQNLVNSPKLSDFDKFSLACEYCMKKDIERLWPAVENDSKLFDIVLGKQPAMYYWIWIMEKTQKNDPIPKDQGQVLAKTILMMKTFHNQFSIEYLWNFIEPDNQVWQITRLISDTSTSIVALPYLIEKLSDRHFNELITSWGKKLMIYVIETMSRPEHILKLWILMKDIISENQFLDIYRFILREECEVGVKYPFRSELIENCKRIWITAPDNLKEYVFDQWILDGDDFFSCYREISSKHLIRSMDLLEFVLEDATEERRSKIWRNNWRDFIFGNCLRSLRKLMELCLDKDEIERFKEVEMTNWANIEDYCISLKADSRDDHLDRFLNFCTSFDSEKKTSLKNQIEQSSVRYVHGSSYSRKLDRLD